MEKDLIWKQYIKENPIFKNDDKQTIEKTMIYKCYVINYHMNNIFIEVCKSLYIDKIALFLSKILNKWKNF